MRVNVSESVEFQCEVGGTQATAQWTYEDDEPLPLGTVIEGTTLMILSVSITDAGRYVCKVTNILDVAESIATLYVKCKCLLVDP